MCAVDVERVDEALAHLGCAAQVVTLDPTTLDAVLESIVDVGTALGAEAEASGLVTSLRERLDTLGRVVASAPRAAVLVLEWTDPPFSAGHWVPDLVTAGGGRPVMGNPGADSQPLNWDAVSTAAAEVVIVAPCGYHLGAAYELAAELVAAGRLPDGAELWAVDADSYFVRPGPRLVDGAELVGQILHPQLCGSPDPTRALRVVSE